MPVTIRALVAEPDLGLVVRCGHQGLDQEVVWVAVSELPDPTPWLDGAELLLTSGMWLLEEEDRAAVADAWAERLQRAGARVVGFGLEPWFDAVPDEVLRAARRHQLTLVEVPRRTPFVAVDRRVADLRAADARRHEADIIRSQQRLARAARGGSEALVTTLAQELRSWVVVLDAAHQHTLGAGESSGIDGEELAGLAREAEATHARSVLSAIREEPVYLVPLGPPDNRIGTLCVAGSSATLTSARMAGLVGTAAALLTVLLPTVDTAVRSAVVDLLLSGDSRSARRICEVAGIAVPDPLVAIAFLGGGRTAAVTRAIALGAWHVPRPTGAVEVVLASPEFASARIEGLLAQGRVRAGLSTAHGAGDVARAVHEAKVAAALTKSDRELVRYEDTTSSGLSTVLASPATRTFVSALLAPLDSHPNRDVLVASAAAWVNANGRWDPAASALGVHRETLRARMARVAEILDVDLDAPQDRLALALALHARSPGLERP